MGKRPDLRVAILGSGNIGTDLLIKTMRSPHLDCTLFVGRNLESQGMQRAAGLGIPVSDKGVDALREHPGDFDLVFDATSAKGHIEHWPIINSLGKTAIDMTPSKVGQMCVPALDPTNILEYQNVNMVSCGGQASIPLAHLIGQVHDDVDYIEVVSSIASQSAGPATRTNLDQYIETTEEALRAFSGCRRSKAILNLNPAQPCIDMQTTIFAKVEKPRIKELKPLVEDMVQKIQTYVPGYELLIPPHLEDGRIMMMVKVRGLGDYLPRYAGNLDIMNCAAISVAEAYAKRSS